MRFYALLVTTIALLTFSVGAGAQIANLRVAEIDPWGNQVEIHNTGGAFTTTVTYPFCHIFNYASGVIINTSFAAGGRKIFNVGSLNDTDSDFFLYRSSFFALGSEIVHGAKYGPAPNVGRTALAASVGLWPSGTAYAPAPPSGMTLAWDGFGFDPKDWYISQTPTIGSAHVTTPGTVASTLAHPSGTQNFENVPLGDEVIAINNWVVVNSSATTGIFTVRAVGDVNSVSTPRGSSTRWLRVRDQDAADVQNRFYTSTITTPSALDYKWTWYVNLEETPPGGGGTKPRLTIQHLEVLFQNAWGIEFTSTGANLVVTGVGGTPASTPIYTLGSPTGVGDWVKLELAVDFTANTVSAKVNDVAAGSLPINLAVTADKSQFRFCYRGEGTGNIGTMLIDDVAVQVIDPLSGVDAPSRPAARLAQNYPNPFNPSTTIEYELSAEAAVVLDVYDAAGRHVVGLENTVRSAGVHTVVWDGRDRSGNRVGSGAYFYRLTAAGQTQQKTMILIK